MKVEDEPFMIEYNCRMGDPETEVVLPRLKNDLVELFRATGQKQLNTIEIDTDPRYACTIMAVSGGYPNKYETGFEITGMEDINPEKGLLFHAGTKNEDGKTLTNGGRILCLTSFGNSMKEAAEKSKSEMQKINFAEMHYRKDIGYEFV